MCLKGFAKLSDMPRLRQMVDEIWESVYLLPLVSDRKATEKYIMGLEPGRRFTKAEVTRIETMHAQIMDAKRRENERV